MIKTQIENIFDLILEEVYLNQARYKKQPFVSSQNSKTWIKEFCTIRLSMGRQIGHTKLATDLYNEKQSFLIVRNNQQKHQLHTLGTNDVFTFGQISKSSFRGRKKPQMVIVDNSFGLSKTKEELLYECLAGMINPGDEFILVFLQ